MYEEKPLRLVSSHYCSEQDQLKAKFAFVSVRVAFTLTTVDLLNIKNHTAYVWRVCRRVSLQFLFGNTHITKWHSTCAVTMCFELPGYRHRVDLSTEDTLETVFWDLTYLLGRTTA